MVLVRIAAEYWQRFDDLSLEHPRVFVWLSNTRIYKICSSFCMSLNYKNLLNQIQEFVKSYLQRITKLNITGDSGEV